MAAYTVLLQTRDRGGHMVPPTLSSRLIGWCVGVPFGARVRSMTPFRRLRCLRFVETLPEDNIYDSRARPEHGVEDRRVTLRLADPSSSCDFGVQAEPEAQGTSDAVTVVLSAHGRVRFGGRLKAPRIVAVTLAVIGAGVSIRLLRRPSGHGGVRSEATARGSGRAHRLEDDDGRLRPTAAARQARPRRLLRSAHASRPRAAPRQHRNRRGRGFGPAIGPRPQNAPQTRQPRRPDRSQNPKMFLARKIRIFELCAFGDQKVALKRSGADIDTEFVLGVHITA